jgi:hypothetical protein
MSEETTPGQELGFLATSGLVGEAMGEYYEKHDQVIANLEARAQVLFARIAPEHVRFTECYSNGDENILCDVEDVMDGFGLLSLSFHKGPMPEADYFLVANYMELSSSVRIYSLYDLGRALCEITEMAQDILKAFRQVVLDGTQSPATSSGE